MGFIPDKKTSSQSTMRFSVAQAFCGQKKERSGIPRRIAPTYPGEPGGTFTQDTAPFPTQ
jgi:hypothetical protein